MQDCKICSEPTNSTYRINFRAEPICSDCGRSIFKQQAEFYIEQEVGEKHIPVEAFIDWLDENNGPNKLRLALKRAAFDMPLPRVNQNIFLSLTGIGQKTWEDFVKNRDLFLATLK